ncbi:hypothetical protein [Paenibacillus xanthanilyticus]|uniref:Uncharacterized protein n=1 Tax=Paenibacillus xanthanilyticus TaxID=1783531 RepID=A0ABV8KA41_9BACL
MSTTSLPTQEEMMLIRDAVILPFLLDLVQNNRTQMELQSNSLRSLYVKSADVLLDRIHKDLVEVRKQMRQKKIKVFEQERIYGDAIHYRFVCRGYEDNFLLMRMVLKSEMSTRLPKYINSIFK